MSQPGNGKTYKVPFLTGTRAKVSHLSVDKIPSATEPKGETQMGISVDGGKNRHRGTSKESLYFNATGSKGNSYELTLNYDSGHFCKCWGMISKIKKYGGVGTLDVRNHNHWCKHVAEARSLPALELRLEARQQRNECYGIHSAPRDPETGRVAPEAAAPAPVPSPTPCRPVAKTDRRRAIEVARKHGDKSPAERLAAIEAEREALLLEIATAQEGLNTTVSSLVSEHGLEAVKAALKAKAS